MILHQVFGLILFNTNVDRFEEREGWKAEELNEDADAFEEVSANFKLVDASE